MSISPDRGGASYRPLAPVATGGPHAGRARQLGSIQALRALAATSVIFMHIPFARWGGFGADIFFVLSGFVMCYITLFDAENFLPKRIFRIVPLYWLGTLAVFGLALIVPSLLNSTSANFAHLAKSLLFVPYMREDHRVMPVLFLGWTLEYEVFFYFVFAAALAISRRVIGRKPKAHLFTIIIAVSLLSLIAILGEAFKPASIVLRFYTNPVILEFAFGAAAFVIWNRYEAGVESAPLVVPLALSVLAYATFLMFDLRILDSHGSYLREIPGFAIRGFLGYVLCMSFLSLESRFKFPKLWLMIGDASYSLYLLHPYLFELVDKKIVSLRFITPATLGVSLLTIIACFALAILSFRVVELPVNKFLRRKFLPPKPTLAV